MKVRPIEGKGGVEDGENEDDDENGHEMFFVWTHKKGKRGKIKGKKNLTKLDLIGGNH